MKKPQKSPTDRLGEAGLELAIAELAGDRRRSNRALRTMRKAIDELLAERKRRK